MNTRRSTRVVIRRARGAVLLLIAAGALTQAPGSVRAEALRPLNSCPATSGIKPLIRGLVDRGVAPPAAGLQATSVDVRWDQLEPTSGTLVPIEDDPIWAAATAPGCTAVRIRVLAGTATPDWVLEDSGGGISVVNPYSGTTGTAGAFWTPGYAADYDQFEQLLAARYEFIPNVAEFVVSRCALFYPEPFLIGTSEAQNDINLLAAGYTEAADQQCQQEEIDTAGADWPTTRIGVSFNPYQTLAPSTNSKGYVTGADEGYTEQMMAYCRYTLGERCVLENDSIRDPISAVGGSTPFYTEMYAAMTGASGPVQLTLGTLNQSVILGAPLAFQTATAKNIQDFWGTLEWAREQHAASVELPVDGTYPPSGGPGAPAWQTLSEVASWFEDVPSMAAVQVNAVQGRPTAGVMVGTIALDERAAGDTTVPYGDVGSVPFDTVTAAITWPTGVTQPALVSIGSGSPATAVTCGPGAACTVNVYSGGYTFPEQEVSGPATVAVTLSAGGLTYTPADGANIVGSVPVTVTPAPLTLKSFAVTPARSAPTVKLSAAFTDADPLGVAADYSVLIAWGDGTTSDIAAQAAGKSFSAGASHRYAHTGKVTVTITIDDTGGATVSGRRTITVR